MNIFPYSNFHDLNLDWLLEAVKQLRTDVDGLIGSATPSNDPPAMDGVAAPGSSVNYSRGDHVHPTDTSRASVTDLADEVTARTNKDLSLDGDIAAVDAKIHFSASNPLMDGAATAGFSTDQARADHIHPTDTSRAAAADLTQEINDRANADTTLQNNINAVDAKIVLATGAPLMDSSSATPGSSTSMARADHVHPTDTSRASATDLATLTARVDSFTGSAIASDAMPQMDGVGAAGTGGNYSRGDHVHPSDTSKLDKAGDTMTGYMLETEREQHILGANTIGWVRVATVPQNPGTLCDFRIVREGALTPAETHKITLAVTQSGIIFADEVSASDVCYVTKIRYSNAGAVDIYLDQNYISDIGIFLDRCAATEAKSKAAKLITPTGVAASPTGETILADYTFVAKTEGAITTPSAGVSGSQIIDSSSRRSGKVVSYHMSISSLTSSEIPVTNGAVLASGLIPPDYMVITLGQYWLDTSKSNLRCRVTTAGNLEVYWDSGEIPKSGQSVIFDITYIAA